MNNLLSTLFSLVQDFKQITEKQNHKILAEGSPDPLIPDQLSNIEKAIHQCRTQLEQKIAQTQTAISRPPVEVKSSMILNASPWENEHTKAFESYLRNGTEPPLLNLEKKSSINNGARSDIGYSVTNKMQTHIEQDLLNLVPFRKIAQVIQISSDSLEIIDDPKGITSGWSDAGLAETEKANATNFERHSIPVHELYAQPKAAQKLIDDPRIRIDEWLSGVLAESFYQKENDAFINGDGEGKPRGILAYTEMLKTIKSANTEKITPEDLIKLFYSLPPQYLQNAKFIMSRGAAQSLRTLQDQKSGQYLWQQNLAEDGGDKLLGAEVIIVPNMPDIGPNNYPIAFGDFARGYVIVDRNGTRILRDPFTHKPYVKFFATRRVGGDVLDTKAICLLQMASK